MSRGRSGRILESSSGTHALATYLPKRICAVRSCWTVLSIYNGADYCWVHERPARLSGSVLRR